MDVNNGNDIPSDRQAELEREANLARSRLMERLAQLDARRDHVVSVVKNATRPPWSYALMAAAGIVATAVIVHRVQSRPRRRFDRFVMRWLTALEPPPAPDGAIVAALKRGAVTALGAGVREIGRRGVERFTGLSEEPAR
jgi:hypothetical protein